MLSHVTLTIQYHSMIATPKKLLKTGDDGTSFGNIVTEDMPGVVLRLIFVKLSIP